MAFPRSKSEVHARLSMYRQIGDSLIPDADVTETRTTYSMLGWTLHELL
jgi:hypothetical protein